MALFAYAFRSIHVVCDLILNIKRENTLATDSTTTNFHTHTDGRKSDVGYRCIYTHAFPTMGGGAVKSKTFFPQHYQRAADELNVKFMDFLWFSPLWFHFYFPFSVFFYFVPKKAFVRNKNILFPNQKYAFRWTKGYQRRQRTKKVVKWRFWTISISIHTYIDVGKHATHRSSTVHADVKSFQLYYTECKLIRCVQSPSHRRRTMKNACHSTGN